MKQTVQDKDKEVAEIREKYMHEVERNRGLEGDTKGIQQKLKDLQDSEANLRSQLDQKTTSLHSLQTRYDVQKTLLDEKTLQIDDLKESVALKITVADDLQAILKES